MVFGLIQLIATSNSFAQIPGGMDGAKMPAIDGVSYAAEVKGEIIIFLVQKNSLNEVTVSSFSPIKIANSLAINIVKTGFKVPVSGFFGKIEAYVLKDAKGALNIVIPSTNSAGGVNYFSWGVSQ